MIELIGNTPIVELKTNSKHTIVAKCEFLNPTGSIKDRVAKYIIQHLAGTFGGFCALIYIGFLLLLSVSHLLLFVGCVFVFYAQKNSISSIISK